MRHYQKYAVANAIPGKDYREIKEYYDIAGPDYEIWSPDFNMHFGYCRSFKDIFSLEKMLVNMNGEVLKQLQINPDEKTHIADLGCGVGTVARYAAKKFPLAKIAAITISDYQVEKGTSLINKENLNNQVFIVKDNFEDLHYANSLPHYAQVPSSQGKRTSDRHPPADRIITLVRLERRRAILSTTA